MKDLPSEPRTPTTSKMRSQAQYGNLKGKCLFCEQDMSREEYERKERKNKPIHRRDRVSLVIIIKVLSFW